MPPKEKRRSPRRAQPSQEPPQAQEPEQSALPSRNDNSIREDSRDATGDDESIPQFFNTTFSTHRVSPLHIGSEPLTASRLAVLSRRLRDILVGDFVRGVQIGTGTEIAVPLGRAGVLENVEWRWVPLDRLLGGRAQSSSSSREGSQELGRVDAGPEDEEGPTQRRGRGRPRGNLGAQASARTSGRGRTRNEEQQSALYLELAYENSTFNALLLPDVSPTPKNKEADILRLPLTSSSRATPAEGGLGQRSDQAQAAFLHLPLLLLKLPAHLKSVLVDFLSHTFDCRVSPLRLGTRTLVRCWEDWLAYSARDRALRQQRKDIILTLGFHLEPIVKNGFKNGQETEKTDGTKEAVPQLGLKSLEVIIPAEELVRFRRAGEKIARRVAEDSATGETPQQNTATKRKLDDTFPTQDGEDTESHRRLRRKLAGGREDEGWGWRNSSSSGTHSNEDMNKDGDATRDESYQQQPFTEALAAYLATHLALDLFHPGVRVQRIACAGFVMAETGRLRISRPRPVVAAPDPDDADADATGGAASAVWDLVRKLIYKARGRGWSADAVHLARLVASAGEETGGRGGVG